MRAGSILLLIAVAVDGYSATLTNHTRRGNKVALQLSEGSGEFEWASSSTFRIRRSLRPEPLSITPLNDTAVNFTDATAGGVLRLETEYLRVEIDRNTLAVEVRTSSGLPLLKEAAPLTKTGSDLTLAWEKAANERIYSNPPIAVKPFWMSSKGYGVQVATLTAVRVDTRGANRVTLAAPLAESFEYFFHYGPGIKDVLEERNKALPVFDPPEASELGWQKSLPRRAVALGNVSPCELIPALVNASLSAILLPAFDLAAYPKDSVQYKRALQLAVISPVFLQSGGTPPQASIAARDRFRPFLITYFDESRTRGFPILHPMPMQFARDLEAANHNDQFMFGDEMLAAPLCGAENKRTVYLPQGIWTNLRTNEVFRGRQTITIEHPLEDPLPPLFARNGTIIPLAPAGKNGSTELHCYPKLGAEFFFYEPDVAEYTQAHASPSTDLYRFEMESKADRLYEWVLHHSDPPKDVSQVLPDKKFAKAGSRAELKPETWWYDPAAKNLHVLIFGPKGGDVIVNARF